MPTSDLDLPVGLYRSPEALADGNPDWTGTLDDFWRDHQEHDFGAIRRLADQLKSHGSIAFGGDDGPPDFWLVRGVFGPVAPAGWAVAETSTEDNSRPLLMRLEEAATLNVAARVRENLCAEAKSTIEELVAVLENLIRPHDHGWKVSDMDERWADARTALAKAKGERP